MSSPLVTVYLPTRNRALLLSEAIHSVLAQSFQDFELIVVDDASEDDTPRVLSTLAAQDPRIHVLTLTTQRGAPAARNAAIAQARGRYITGLDDDDLMLPERLATMMAAYRDEFSFLCTGFAIDRVHRRRCLNTRSRTISLDDLLHFNPVGNQIFTLTERLRAIGGFDESFPASQDHDLWTRLAMVYGSGYRDGRVSYVYRSSITEQNITVSPQFVEGALAFEKKYAHMMSPDQRRSQKLLQIMKRRLPLRLRDIRAFGSRATYGIAFEYWLGGFHVVRRILRLPPRDMQIPESVVSSSS